jgi:hypothetical protein
MRRREFIAGSIAVAAEKSVLPSSAWAQSAPRINRIIDAHCHVFNAADLPIEGFTKKIMVPKSAQTSELVARFADYPGALEALVHAITVQRPWPPLRGKQACRGPRVTARVTQQRPPMHCAVRRGR